MKMKIRELRKLPHKEWNKEGLYKSLLIINSGKKHDSGWALMYVIGVDDDGNPKEIAGVCDDINWHTALPSEYTANLRTDMYYPSGIIRMWSNQFLFCIKGISSLDIKLIKKQK